MGGRREKREELRHGVNGGGMNHILIVKKKRLHAL